MLEPNNLLLLILAVLLLVSFAAFFLAASANRKYKRLYRQYDYFMRGKDAETLEDYFVDLQEHVERLEESQEQNRSAFRILNEGVKNTYQKKGIIRYNAYGGQGGNLSFALALLDYQNSGFVLNSVYSEEGSFLYIKEVMQGTTEVELGAEEKLALETALGYH